MDPRQQLKKEIALEKQKIQANIRAIQESHPEVYNKLTGIFNEIGSIEHFNQSPLIVELYLAQHQKSEGFTIFKEIYDQIEKLNALVLTVKKDTDLALFFTSIKELHKVLVNMSNKQTKLNEILLALKKPLLEFIQKNPNEQNFNINVLIELYENLGSAVPYPDLTEINHHCISKYIEEFNVLLSNSTHKNVQQLIVYLAIQYKLALSYEKSKKIISQFLKQFNFESEFNNGFNLKNPATEIEQLLIEPVQYLPRFNLLLDANLKLIKNVSEQLLPNKQVLFGQLEEIKNKVGKLADNLNLYLNCRFPDEINLILIQQAIKSNLFDAARDEFLYQLTLRQDRLKVIQFYIERFLKYLEELKNYRLSWGAYLFSKSNTVDQNILATKIEKEWINYSPAYVAAFNQFKNATANSFFKDSMIKMLQKSLEVLIKYSAYQLEVTYNMVPADEAIHMGKIYLYYHHQIKCCCRNSSGEIVRITIENDFAQKQIIELKALLDNTTENKKISRDLCDTFYKIVEARGFNQYPNLMQHSNNTYILAYALELEDITNKLIAAPNYIPNINKTIEILEQIKKLGAHEKDRRKIYNQLKDQHVLNNHVKKAFTQTSYVPKEQTREEGLKARKKGLLQ